MSNPLPRMLARYLKEHGLKQADLALRLEVAQATISRWISGKQSPDSEQAKRIARLLGVTVDALFFNQDDKVLPISTVPIVGTVQAGLWVEAVELPEDDQQVIPVPADSRYPEVPRFALRVSGDSMNELYPHGSFVICVKFLDLNRNPTPGERVVVCRHSLAQDAWEASVKELRVGDGGIHYLVPRSSKPDFSPIRLNDDGTDQDGLEVTIWALVVGSFSYE